MATEHPRAKSTVSRPSQSAQSAQPTRPASKPASTSMENAIKERAYILWEKAGKPHGRDVEFWIQAKKEIQG